MWLQRYFDFFELRRLRRVTIVVHLDQVEGIIFDLEKIEVKITSDAVNSCYTPIVQSGGVYDIKVSAQSNAGMLSPDVILCSLGCKYKEYCANVSRTFLVDAPTKVEETYSVLMTMYEKCLEKMVPGAELKEVYNAAKAYLTSKDATLLTYLPKTLGFAMGLQFRDSTLLLNDKSTMKFAEGMVFNISVGFHNVPLAAEDKQNAVGPCAKLEQFSLLVADTVLIVGNGPADILTKISRELGSISYNIASKEGGEEEEDEEDEDGGGLRRSNRRSAAEASAVEAASMQRVQRQQELMQKKIAEALRKLKNGGRSQGDESQETAVAVDLKTYSSPEDYPRDTLPTQVKVDLDKEALILPINGQPVPFHISTIKNITRPEEGQATEMRVNFYIPGSASNKDVPKNMQQLVVKYGDRYVFVKEMTFKAQNSKNLSQVYQQFQELRKRVKQREQRAEQEKDLVVQQKLVKIKDQRIPRLQDLSMRPSMSGRKCIGTLEAHQNGLRFTSTKNEQIDIMYANIKHAIYQPCDKTTMVLVHFHLKDFIMVGKKKQKDIQFYTEVVDASLNLENSRRSNYDPDELDEEQQERELRKRLNIAFKEFCMKVEKVASHYGYSMQVDVPFRKSGFEGNCNKEMVFLQPTTHCLVNLTETPPFVLALEDVEHCHFERVNYATKNFDIVFIFKNYSIAPRIITAVDMKDMEKIEDWLNLVEITYTKGAKTMSWDAVMEIVREQGDQFFMDVDEEGDKKPAGWLFLSAEDSDDEGEEDEEDEDSSYASDADDSSEEESDESDEDDSDEYVDSDEDDDDEDEDEDSEEEGKVS
jgi:nucleosome binding factor SPN SPT16 subunit